MLRDLVAHDHLPDYAVEMNGDTVTFRNREALDTVEAIEAEPERPYIDPEGFHDAKSVAPGYDVYALYDQWVSWWIDSGRPELKTPAPPSSASAATSTRPPPCASIGVYSYTPILAGDAPPPLLPHHVVQRTASTASNGGPFLRRKN